MPLSIVRSHMQVVCDDPYNRLCQNSVESILTGSERVSSLERRGWSVDEERGITVCPTCRAIPPGGGDMSRFSNEQLLAQFQKVFVERIGAINSILHPHLVALQKDEDRLLREILRRLNYKPRLEASQVQS